MHALFILDGDPLSCSSAVQRAPPHPPPRPQGKSTRSILQYKYFELSVVLVSRSGSVGTYSTVLLHLLELPLATVGLLVLTVFNALDYCLESSGVRYDCTTTMQ